MKKQKKKLGAGSKKERGGGEGGNSICARELDPSTGTNLTVVQGMRHCLTMHIL